MAAASGPAPQPAGAKVRHDRDIRAETIDDAAAARLLANLAPVIGELSLARTRVTDASMPLNGTMTGLRRLDLRASGVTMAGLRHLHSSTSSAAMRTPAR